MKINISNQEKRDSSSKVLDISWGTILKIVSTVIALAFLWAVKDLLVWFLFALVISILFEPIIGFFVKKRLPRVVAAVLVYFFVFGILSYAFYSSLPYFITEIQRFSSTVPQHLPEYFEKVSPFFSGLGLEAFESFDNFLLSVRKPFEEMARNVFSTLITFLGGFFAAFFTISMAFFLSLEQGLMEKGLTLFFPKRFEAYLYNLWQSSKRKVVGWFLMRIVGVLFVGLSAYLSFKILGVHYPVSLAALMGIFDFIPIVGPLVATIFVVMVVSTDSLLKALFVFAALGLIQLIENAILLPALSKRMIRVPSVVVLVALFIGGKLWGVLGAILAVPLFAILFEFLKDFIQERKEELFLNKKEEVKEEQDL